MSTILLVEDDNTSRELLVHRLVNCGYQVLQAACGKDAKEMVLCCLPDLILLDVTLPDINGLKILESLKSNTKTAEIPIIVVSGRDSNDDVIKGLSMGASDYITKPYQWGIIMARIKSALRNIDATKLLKEALYQEKLNVQDKSTFLVNMSQEIREPLNGILGLIQQMNQTSLDDMQKQYLRLMDSSGGALLNIVNNLFDLSRAEEGTLETKSVPFNLEQLVKSVTQIIYQKACQKSLDIFIHVAEGVSLNVIGDPERISQILTNYALNAVKFTESGCITFKISANEGTSVGCCYRIIVEDTGIGLSQAAQKRLFQKFIQGDSTASGEDSGSGLGLSICKQIAKTLGGHVGMSSAEDKGTEFWLEIPLKFDDEDEVTDTASLEGKNVLLIGHSNFCTNYSHILSQWGLDTSLENGLSKSVLKNTGYDLVITNEQEVADKLHDVPFRVIQIHRGLMEKSSVANVIHLHEPVPPTVLKQTMLDLIGQA